MEKAIVLRNFEGEETRFVVVNAESVICAFCYTCSGDECMAFIYNDGGYVIADSGEDNRLLSCGPEDAFVLLPDDIPWEKQVYDA